MTMTGFDARRPPRRRHELRRAASAAPCRAGWRGSWCRPRDSRADRRNRRRPCRRARRRARSRCRAPPPSRRRAVISAPDCERNARSPGQRHAMAKLALSPMRGSIRPRQFGPWMRSRYGSRRVQHRLLAARRDAGRDDDDGRACPCAPSSAMRRRHRRRRRRDDRRDRAWPAARRRTDSTACPAISACRGLTNQIGPAKPPPSRFRATMRPTLPASGWRRSTPRTSARAERRDCGWSCGVCVLRCRGVMFSASTLTRRSKCAPGSATGLDPCPVTSPAPLSYVRRRHRASHRTHRRCARSTRATSTSRRASSQSPLKGTLKAAAIASTAARSPGVENTASMTTV